MTINIEQSGDQWTITVDGIAMQDESGNMLTFDTVLAADDYREQILSNLWALASGVSE